MRKAERITVLASKIMLLAEEIANLQREELPDCPVCGGQVDGRFDAIYCSDACRMKAYRKRKQGVAA